MNLKTELNKKFKLFLFKILCKNKKKSGIKRIIHSMIKNVFKYIFLFPQSTKPTTTSFPVYIYSKIKTLICC